MYRQLDAGTDGTSYRTASASERAHAEAIGGTWGASPDIPMAGRWGMSPWW
jgi:hypothetical protein